MPPVIRPPFNIVNNQPAVAPKGYRLRQIIVQAAASEAAVDLLRDLALGRQPERPLTAPHIPAWAALAMEAPHHG